MVISCNVWGNAVLSNSFLPFRLRKQAMAWGLAIAFHTALPMAGSAVHPCPCRYSFTSFRYRMSPFRSSTLTIYTAAGSVVTSIVAPPLTSAIFSPAIE